MNPMTVYGVYKCNRLYGKCVVVVREYVYVCNVNADKERDRDRYGDYRNN